MSKRWRKIKMPLNKWTRNKLREEKLNNLPVSGRERWNLKLQCMSVLFVLENFKICSKWNNMKNIPNFMPLTWLNWINLHFPSDLCWVKCWNIDISLNHYRTLVAFAVFLIISYKVYNLLWILLPEFWVWVEVLCLTVFLAPFLSFRSLR